MACGLYCLLVAALLHGASPGEAYQEAIRQAQAIYQQPPFDDEARHFARLFSGQMAQIPEADISTKGYIIATLEASVWCLLNTGAFEEAVLKAVNLGGDTDPNPMYGSMSIMVSRLEK